MKHPRETKTVLIDGTIHQYTIRRSRRAKHILLHVYADSSIEAVVPWGAAYRQAEAFVEARAEWLARHIQKQRQRKAEAPTFELADKSELPWFGTSFQLRLIIDPAAARTSLREESGAVQVRSNTKENAHRSVVRWYRTSSREYFIGQALKMARKIGVEVAQVRVNNPKTQWGSCNKQAKTLTFSWRLALAPLEVAHYVVAHEVAHLRYANHGPQFWRQVEVLVPTYKDSQAWLRRHGTGLELQ